MTTEQIDAKKIIELGFAGKNKEKFDKEFNISDLLKAKDEKIASWERHCEKIIFEKNREIGFLIYKKYQDINDEFEQKIHDIMIENQNILEMNIELLSYEKDCEISRLNKRMESRKKYFDREIEHLREIIEIKNSEIIRLEERIKNNCKTSIDDTNERKKIKNLESDLDFYKRRSDNFKSEYETSKCQHELAIFAFQLLHKEHKELEKKLGSKQSFLNKFCNSPAVIALKKYLSE